MAYYTPVVAGVTDDKPKLSVSIISDYSKTKNPIQVKDKTFTFQTGSIGVRGTLDFDEFGEFYLQYGRGYSPSESATFAGAEVSGAMDIESFSYGYVYPYDIVNTPWSVDFKINKTTNNHDGDNFTGFRYDKPVTASVDALSSFTRIGIGLNYQINNYVVLTAGTGVYDWNISAKAKGSFVDSSGIRFSTDTEASGTDRFHFLETHFKDLDRQINLGVRQSNLNADNQNVLREIFVGISLSL